MELHCKGEYGIERAEELREQLLHPLAQGDEAVIDFSQVEHADYSFFQLIQSAIKTYAKNGGALVLRPNLPDALAEEAARMGLGMLARTEKQQA